MMTRGIIYFSAGWIFASAQADTSTTSCYDTAVLGAPFGGAIFNQRSPRANDTTFQHDHGDHLTAASCHASRTLHGPANAFSELQRKMAGSCAEPVRIAVLGGSVSCGNFASDRRDGPCPWPGVLNKNSKWLQGCKEQAYPAYLAAILRQRRRLACGTRYPDKSSTPTNGMTAAASIVGAKGSQCWGDVVVDNMCKRACGSDYFVQTIAGNRSLLALGYDVVVVEVAQNDQGHVTTAPDGTNDHPIEKWTELLAWQLLSRPSPPGSASHSLPAVVWLEASWFNEHNQERGGHSDASAEHATVLQRYRLPQVSMFEALRAAMPSLPAAALPGRDRPSPAATEALKWLSNVYFADNMHPSVLGHKMIASVLAYNLLDADSAAHLPKDSSSKSASTTQLPGPFYVAPSLAAAYAGGQSHRLSLTTSGDLKKALLPGSDALKGFLVYEDVAGKPGLIARDVGASVVLQLPIPQDEPPAKVYLVNVGHLVSYNHMGKFSATAEHFRECPLTTEAWQAATCTAARASSASSEGSKAIARKEVDGLTWPPGAARVSVWSPALLQVPARAAGDNPGDAPAASPCVVLRVQVIASHDPEAWARRKEEVPRRENKVKLYDVTWAASND